MKREIPNKCKVVLAAVALKFQGFSKFVAVSVMFPHAG
jgi:hypothetical protein